MISAAADSRGAFAFRFVLRFVYGRVFAVGQSRAVFFQVLVESRLLFFLSDGVNGFFGLVVNDAARDEQPYGNDRRDQQPCVIKLYRTICSKSSILE